MPPSSTKNVPTEMPQQRSYEYYLSTADDDSAQIEANREWRREENRKKKEDKKFYKKYGNWRPNEPYKMRYPTNIAAFKAMDGWQKKDEQFRDFLKTARRKAQAKNDSDEVRDTHAVAQSGSHSPSVAADPMFAPPSWDQDKSSDPSTPSRAVEESHVPEKANVLPAPSVVPPPNDEPTTVAPVVSAASVAQSAQEAFALRVELAKQLAASVKKPSQSPPPPPPPPSDGAPAFLDGATPPPPPAYNPTISAPPVRYNPTISAEPVHYARPSAPATRGIGNDDDESQGRPKKKQKTVEPPKPSKAALMMAKMGYKKGQGLGKNNDGAIVALEVKARKDNSSRPMRDEFDEDGGKIIKSQQVFDILGGHRKEKHEAGPFGEPSCVIVTWGCVDGVDWALDADRNDGGIRQEMGDAFNTKVSVLLRSR
jgi:splicing factor 45